MIVQHCFDITPKVNLLPALEKLYDSRHYDVPAALICEDRPRRPIFPSGQSNELTQGSWPFANLPWFIRRVDLSKNVVMNVIAEPRALPNLS